MPSRQEEHQQQQDFGRAAFGLLLDPLGQQRSVEIVFRPAAPFHRRLARHLPEGVGQPDRKTVAHGCDLRRRRSVIDEANARLGKTGLQRGQPRLLGHQAGHRVVVLLFIEGSDGIGNGIVKIPSLPFQVFHPLRQNLGQGATATEEQRQNQKPPVPGPQSLRDGLIQGLSRFAIEPLRLDAIDMGQGHRHHATPQALGKGARKLAQGQHRLRPQGPVVHQQQAGIGRTVGHGSMML